MTTDFKFLEGYATVMKQNNVSPVAAFQLMQKEAAIPWKALGLIAAGGLGATGVGYGAYKTNEALSNAKKQYERYSEGLDQAGRSSAPVSGTSGSGSSFQNWTNLPVATPTDGVPVQYNNASRSTTTPSTPSTPAANVDPLKARENALNLRHYKAKEYQTDQELQEKQREYDAAMQGFTNPSALTTIASRIPGLNYFTDMYNQRAAKNLEDSKANLENLRGQLEQFRADAARYK